MTKNKKFIVILTIVFLVLNIYGYFFRKDKNQKFNESGKYLVGITTGTFHGKGTLSIKYSFFLDGKKHNNAMIFGDEQIKENGGRYFVVFLPEDPNVNEILLDKPVPVDILKAPANGWSKEEFDNLIGKKFRNFRDFN